MGKGWAGFVLVGRRGCPPRVLRQGWRVQSGAGGLVLAGSLVVQSWSATSSGGLFSLVCGPARTAKRAARLSRPTWVGLPCRRSSKRDYMKVSAVRSRSRAMSQRAWSKSEGPSGPTRVMGIEPDGPFAGADAG